MSDVDVAVLRRHGRVVERQAGPQQAADHAHFAGALELEAPRRCQRRTEIDVKRRKRPRHRVGAAVIIVSAPRTL